MNIVSKIAKNIFSSLFIKIVSPMFSLLFIIYISRYLGVDGLGKYTSIVTLQSIFSTFAILGIDTLITREVARDKSQTGNYLVNSLFIGISSSITMMLLMYITMYLLGYPEDVKLAIYVISFSIIFIRLSNCYHVIFLAYEKFEYVALLLLFTNIIKVVVGVLILIKGFNVVILMFSWVISEIIGFLFSIFLTYKYIGRFSVRIDLVFCKMLFKNTITFALITIFSAIYWQIDIIMLSKFGGMIETGLYSAAYKLVNIGLLIPWSFGMALFPTMSQLNQAQVEKLAFICQNSIKYLFIIIIPIAFGVTIFADNIIGLIYGDKFINASNSFKILIWILVPWCAVRFFAYALVACGYQKVDLLTNVIGVVCIFALNWILIPQYGHIGTSIATVTSMCILLLLQYIFINKYIFKINLFKLIYKPLIAALIMSIFIIALINFNILIILSTSVFVFSLLIYIFKGLSKEDFDILRKIKYDIVETLS